MNKDEFDEAARRHLEYLKATSPKTNWWPIVFCVGVAVICLILLAIGV